MDLVAILVGGALGGMARFGLADAVGRRVSGDFPWGILLVNASGALAIGIAAACLPVSDTGALETLAWQLGAIGFLGSYTTVSSFSLQTLSLLHGGKWRAAAANIILSLGLCIGGAAAGFWLGSRLVLSAT